MFISTPKPIKDLNLKCLPQIKQDQKLVLDSLKGNERDIVSIRSHISSTSRRNIFDVSAFEILLELKNKGLVKSSGAFWKITPKGKTLLSDAQIGKISKS
ncbi:MAG: hypothetical protein WCT07_00610 [Candidatus Paceibacterota bacterium]|jgi:hypothetical protein